MAEEKPAKKKSTNPFLAFGLGVGATVIIGVLFIGGTAINSLDQFGGIVKLLPKVELENVIENKSVEQKVLKEESVVIDVAEAASPSVVTVSITTEQRSLRPRFNDPFGFFGQQEFFEEGPAETIEQDIGTGFVIDESQGLVVTNKHVVSNGEAEYTVITQGDEEFKVVNIYRDPVNDLAILKIDGDVPALEMGDSDQLKVGQFVMAIGTALGEFRHTVTTGVVSGLSRGIEAGNGLGGAVDHLENVIQTDAAINPGNSGGPLLNSAGQVIGVNVAIAAGSENIGFAIPINIIKESIDNFNETGQFDRPFLGVKYRMIPRDTALMNDVPEGAYIVEVVEGSAADEAGIEAGDIVTKMNGEDIKDAEGGLAEVINSLKAGQSVVVDVYRDGEQLEFEVKLKTSE